MRVVASLVPTGEPAATRVVVEYEATDAHQISFAGDELERLPGSRTVWSILEIAHPYVVAELVADGLGQGAEIVQAYRRRGQRFTYTMTVDARVEKRFAFGGRSAAVVLEVFDLLNQALEVEEDIVTGPRFRTVTAVQPPRGIRLGVRATF